MTITTKKPLPPFSINSAAVTPRQRNDAVVDYRTIKTVIDTTLPGAEQVRTTQNVLDSLSPAAVAAMRTEIGNAYAVGKPRFLCASCGEPVLMLQRLPGPDVPKDGRGAYFKHYPFKGAGGCVYRTPDDVGARARKYDGVQEGFDHDTLKHQLADCLRADGRFAGVDVEYRVTAPGGGFRVPDVAATFGGRLVAFDLQLATLSIGDILARTAFYATLGIRHVWLTDAVDLTRLTQQAFLDLYLNMGGRIFAIDYMSVAASLASGRFQLQELRIVPRLASGLAPHNVWHRELVETDVIFMKPELRTLEGRLRYRDALAEQANALFGSNASIIRQAIIRGQGLRPIGLHWDHMSLPIGGTGVLTAIADGLEEVLAQPGPAVRHHPPQRPRRHPVRARSADRPSSLAPQWLALGTPLGNRVQDCARFAASNVCIERETLQPAPDWR